MSEGSDETEAKSRRNAIITYEKVDQLGTALAVANTKLDGVITQLAQFGQDHTDHEVRIRALELTQAQFIAASTSRQGTAAWVWMAIITAINTGVAILNYANQP